MRRLTCTTMLVCSACLWWTASCVGDDPDAEPVPDAGAAADTSTADTASGTDTGSGDSGSPDSGGDGDAEPACNPQGAFQPAVEVPGLHLADANELSFRLSSDGQTAIVTRNFTANPGVFVQYVATRQSNGGFDTGAVMGGDVNVPEGGVSNRGAFADNDLTLYYEASRDGGTAFDLFAATRSSKAAVFTSSTNLGANVNTAKPEGQPYFVGSNLYFTRYPDPGPPSVMRAVRTGTTFSMTADTLANLTGYAFPVVLPGELAMFVGDSVGDIHFTSRTTPTGTFGVPVKLDPPVTTTDYEEPVDVTPDGCTLYVGRGDGNTRRIYSLTRAK